MSKSDGDLPKYRLVEAHIREQIMSNQWTDKLPGERVIAEQLQVSYMTVRKAIVNLERAGVLRKEGSRGTFVADSQPRPKSKNHTIGYYLDQSVGGGVSAPYYALLFQALQSEAQRHGYSLIYFSNPDANALSQHLSKLDGVIASCFPRIESVIQQIAEQVPVVVVDNQSSDKQISSVVLDNFSALQDGVTALVEAGHRRIAFMTGLDDSDVGRNRYAGYRAGLVLHGIAYDDELVFRGDYTFPSGVAGGEYLLSLPELPTAVLCANDSMALGVMRRLAADDVRVPEHISVVGFDDIEVAEQIVPSLSTLRAPVEEIAQLAFAELMTQKNSEEAGPTHHSVAAQLIMRQTTKQLSAESSSESSVRRAASQR